MSPERAVEAVREAFVAYARGEWTMPPKVYVPAYPAGDFRAMPALGGGYAALKWVTSFPGNPAKGLPTVTGLVLLSSADDGRLVACFDAAAVTALRTGAAAVLAAETLGRADARSAAVIGAGVNGKAAARTFLARGRSVAIFDMDAQRAEQVAAELDAGVSQGLEDALAADLIVTMTPGHTPVISAGNATARPTRQPHGRRRAGKGGDRRRRAGATRVFCDDWEQASHNGELAHAVDSGAIGRDDVTDLGAVLDGQADGRRSLDEITAFDSTGLAIQDLTIALAALERAGELDLLALEL